MKICQTVNGELHKNENSVVNRIIISQGRHGIQQTEELKDATVDQDTMVSETLRENLFKKMIDAIFASGSGDFEEDGVYNKNH